MGLKSKQFFVTLFTGVFILVASGCESSITTPSDNERETLQDAVASLKKTRSEMPMREPGEIDPFYLTELLGELIRQNGGNPDELEFGGLSEKGFALAGEEAWYCRIGSAAAACQLSQSL